MQAVVFDIGGVLLDWDPRLAYRDLVSDPAELDRFLAEVCTSAWNAELDRGRPFDEACDELAARHPDHAALIHAWKRQDRMIAGEVPGTAAVADEVRAAGVPTYLLTNMPADVFRTRVEDWPVLQRFDGAVVSGEEGLLKPEPGLFAVLAERFALDPSRCLFIDDSPANVDGAVAVGFQGHRFVDAPTLRTALVDAGVLAPA